MRPLTALLILILASRPLTAADMPRGTGLNGCLYWIDGTCAGWSEARWGEEARAMHDAGLRHVIVCAVAEAGLAADDAEHAASRPASTSEAVLMACDRFMRAADAADLYVYLSLCAQPGWYVRWNLAEEVQANRRGIPLMIKRYAAHVSFAGWYIPHEI